MLEDYAQKYRRNLNEGVIPFWLKNSPDRKHGGYFTCLDQHGRVYDDRKYMWLQGRSVWMFSRLYRCREAKPEYLDAAKIGVDFLRRFGRDEQGRVYFCLTRDGRCVHFQRKPFAAVFVMLGLLEYARAAGDAACRREAMRLFAGIRRWMADPTLLGRVTTPGLGSVSSLASVMCTAAMALELADDAGDDSYDDVLRECVGGILAHRDATHGVLREHAYAKDSEMARWPEGRLFSPGHSIEVVWFLLHLLERFPDETKQQLALDILSKSLALGWDETYGGFFNFMDLAGRPPLAPEAEMKYFWPLTEAVYALTLAYAISGEGKWVEWLRRVDAWAFEHLVDDDGAWFGYCNRRGELALRCKGGNYFGFFHVPRALTMTTHLIESKGL